MLLVGELTVWLRVGQWTVDNNIIDEMTKGDLTLDELTLAEMTLDMLNLDDLTIDHLASTCQLLSMIWKPLPHQRKWVAALVDPSKKINTSPIVDNVLAHFGSYQAHLVTLHSGQPRETGILAHLEP